MSDLSLFTPTEEPPQHCTLDGRRYRAQLTARHGKLYVLVEYDAGPEGWKEVRWLNRRVDVVRALGMGDWDGKQIMLTDGRKELEPIDG